MNIRNSIILLVVVFSILGEFGLTAQDVNSLNTSKFFESPLIGRRYINKSGLGSPYLYGSFMNGCVVLTSGDTVFNKKLKFDCYRNELIWLANGADLVSLDVNLIRAFSIASSNGVYRNFEQIPSEFPVLVDSTVKYIEKMSTGRVSLYSYRKITVLNETVSSGSGGMYQVNKYVPRPEFYIKVGNSTVKQVQLAKNSLIKAYPEYAEEIKRILRENNLGKIKKEWELIDAIKLLNTNLTIN